MELLSIASLVAALTPQLDNFEEENNPPPVPQPQQQPRSNRRMHSYIDAADENRKSGNAAFEAGDFKKAVESYSRAIMLKIHEGPTASDYSENGRKKRATTALLYSNRACSLIRMASLKMDREVNAVNNNNDNSSTNSSPKPWFTSVSLQEPSSLELLAGALSDADRALSLRPDWIKGWLRRGQACLALKLLKDAIESYKKALSLDSTNVDAKRGLIEAQTMLGVEAASLRSYVQYLASNSENAQQPQRNSDKQEESTSMDINNITDFKNSMEIEDNQPKGLSIEDFECVLCAKLFWQPVTTPCGHTYCKDCLLKAMEYGGSCPLCRTTLHFIDKKVPLSVVLQTVIQKNFPEEYKRREQESLANELIENNCLPLFIVNAVVYPNMPLPMHIFEPRYILMLRRCMASQKTFGLVSTKRGANGEYEPHNVGCALLITSCNTLPGGRSYIDTIGTRRFKVNESWVQDEYSIGRITWIDDEPITSEQQQEIEELVGFFRSLYETCTDPRGSSQSSILKNVMRKADAPPSNSTAFSFWLAHHLPLPLENKQEILGMRSVLERLRYMRQHISSTSTCNIM